MSAWGNIKVGDERIRTLVLPPKMRAAGITIASITSVIVAVLETSVVKDDTPQALLNGAAQINSAPIVDGFRTIGIGQALLIPLKGRTLGCSFVVTPSLVLSTNEKYSRDVVQYVAEYVPSI